MTSRRPEHAPARLGGDERGRSNRYPLAGDHARDAAPDVLAHLVNHRER